MNAVPPHLHAYLPGCDCQDRIKLRALVQRNGLRQYALFCLDSLWRGNFIPKKIAVEVAVQHGCAVDDVPVIQDNRDGCCDGSGCPKCVRDFCAHCGSRQRVQWHHWAPWHLFADANEWPISPLCAECHHLWHRIVTPAMNRRAG